MARTITSNKLNKNAILSKIPQTHIFSKYFNISLDNINYCINTGNFIISPLRYDEFPTCGFQYDNKGKLKFRDFAGYFWGDCFDAVAFIISNMYNKKIDISKKEDFMFVLRHISFTFKDIFYNVTKNKDITKEINKTILQIKNEKPIIECVIREWNDYDIAYWNKFGIDVNTLNINFVFPIDQYYINKFTNPYPKYFYDVKDPCYAYITGVDKNNINDIKLYFPKRNKKAIRFIANYNHLEGIYNLNKDNYDVIVLTKSTKDRISMVCYNDKYSNLSPYNIGFINIPHETYKIRRFEYDYLCGKLNKNGIIISCMDNDFTGKKQANYLKETYDISKTFIPTKYDCKDFAELKDKYSDVKINKIINTFIKYIKHEQNNKHKRDIEASSSSPF